MIANIIKKSMAVFHIGNLRKFILISMSFVFLYSAHSANAGFIINRPLTIGLSDGLVGYWTFDGPDTVEVTAYDKSGQGRNGTLTSGPKRISGKIGQGLNLNGSNSYVDIGTGPTSVNTVSFWVYPKTTTEYFINLTSTTDYIWVSGGTVTATGLTSPIIYVNGIVSSILSANEWQHVVITTTTSENASNLDIGRTQDANVLEGTIDDVRIYNRVLTTDEIKRLYKIGATTKIGVSRKDTLRDGLIAYWTFDGPDTAGTTAYDRSGQGKNGSMIGNDISPNGLISWWKLDEGSGTDANDGSGTGNKMTLATSPNTPTWTTSSKIGANALSFDGAGDFASITGLLGNPANITLAAWVNLQTADITGAEVISLGDHIALRADDNSTSCGGSACEVMGFFYDGSAWNVTSSQTNIAGTGWHHLAYVFDDTADSQIIYIDGAQTGSNANVNSISYTGLGQSTFIGTHGDAGTDMDFNGSIDDARVYNQALSADEIKKLYNYGLAKHAPTAGKIGQALNFDKIYVDAGNVTASANSIAFWMNTASTSPYGRLFDLNSTTRINVANGVITTTNITSPTIFVDGSVSSAVNNGWHHITITTGTAINASAMEFGRATTTSFDGIIDDVRVYNRVISNAEIKRLYKIGGTTKIGVSRKDTLTDGLVGYWTFDGPDTVEVTAYDRSGQGNNGTLTNGPARIAGKIGQGMEFDGTNDYIDVPDSTSLDLTTFTVSYWAKGNTAPDTLSIKQIFSKGASAEGLNYQFAWSHTDSAFKQSCALNDGVWRASQLTSALSANVWYHIVCVRDSSGSLKAYLNGVEEAFISTGNPSTGALLLTIGSGHTNVGAGANFFDGAIDDVRIYNRALSTDEIKRLYNMGQ